MTTTDSNGVVFYETTDPVSPLQTLLNLGQASVSAALNSRSKGIIGNSRSSAAQAGSGTIGTYTQISALDVTVTLTRNTRVKATFSGSFSVTGTGPNDISAQIRYAGATVVASGRATAFPTNGNGDLVAVDVVDLVPGTYTFSVWFTCTSSGGSPTPQFRGNIRPGQLLLEDGGTY